MTKTCRSWAQQWALLALIVLSAAVHAEGDPAPKMHYDKEARLRDLTSQWPGQPQRCL